MTAQNNCNSDIWILLDFNSSKRYSHHWSYLKRYNEFILQNFKSSCIEVWIPKCVDREIVKELGNAGRTLLRSPSYSYRRSENLILWFRDRIAAEILSKRFKNLKLEKFISNAICYFYLINVIKRIRSIHNKYETVNLVFPSINPLAFCLIDRMKKSGFATKIFMRFLGGENSGFFSRLNFAEDLNRLILQNPKSVRVGCETRSNHARIMALGVPNSNNYIVPLPSQYKKVNRLKSQENEVTFGFLGSARPNKGFENIPVILESLSKARINFKVRIQKAIFPWPSYLKTLEILNLKYSDKVKFIEGNIGIDEFDFEWNLIDFLVLPYNVEFYKYAGSGLLFEANDRDIQVIAPFGTAFSKDIEDYGIGFLYDTSENFAKAFANYKSKTSYVEFLKNSKNYREERNFANNLFFESD